MTISGGGVALEHHRSADSRDLLCSGATHQVPIVLDHDHF